MTYLKLKGLVQHGTYHHFGRREKRKILKILKYNYSCKTIICSIYKIYGIFQQSRFLSTLQHLKRCVFYMATPLRPRVAQIVKCLWLCRANYVAMYNARRRMIDLLCCGFCLRNRL